ncbi:MAG: hypothetical protein RR945_02225 [Erysipelotrichaceae bacterium]
MNIDIIKTIYDKSPNVIKFTLGKLIRNKLINNKIFKDQYNLLVQSDFWNKEKKGEYQFNLLKETLIHAYENTIYYHKLFDDVNFNPYKFSDISEFKVIPYLTKEKIRTEFDKLKAYDIPNYYSAKTGGTTGKPIEILLDKNSIYKERAFVYHYWSHFGFNYKKSKLITFREVEFSGKQFKYNPMYNEIILNPFLLCNDNFIYYVNRINRFGGDFFYGYPSLISNFCRMIKNNGSCLEKKVKGVFLISENVYPDQIKIIKEVLDCPISIFYGHTERAVFAEMYNNNYYFNNLYCFEEIIDTNEGNIVTTGFLNGKMPLIRYLVDDVAEETSLDVYKITGHRGNECLYGKNGEVISAVAIEFGHSGAFKNVIEYQFEQNKLGEVIFRIKTEEKISEDEVCAIKQEMNKRLPYFDCKIITNSNIKRSARGKYKMIIQNLKENQL